MLVARCAAPSPRRRLATRRDRRLFAHGGRADRCGGRPGAGESGTSGPRARTTAPERRMNKFWIGALIVAAVGGLALWQLGVFEPKADPVVPADAPPVKTGGTDGPGLVGAPPPAADEPKDQPDPEWFPLESQLRVL